MTGRVLVLGITGMLGNAVFRVFRDGGWEVYGTARSEATRLSFPYASDRIIAGVEVENVDSLTRALVRAKPDLVVNCVGVIKQLQSAKDPLVTIPINALLPHRLAGFCAIGGARLFHVSTDCVFSGRKGDYAETDAPDADDLYGRSKLLGEVDYPHAVTLRTSIIGHELHNGANGLVGWFLSQSHAVKGYRRAVFSGLPTVTLAKIMRDVVVPRSNLHGLYHVSAEPIDKLTLLRLVRDAYGRQTVITPDDSVVIDRSLNSERFRSTVDYMPPSWPELIHEMRAFG